MIYSIKASNILDFTSTFLYIVKVEELNENELTEIMVRYLISTFFVLMASNLMADECSVNPNKCNPKQLCELATESVGDKTTWTTSKQFAPHVSLVKQLGMNCGRVYDLCDVQPAECSITELCSKATVTVNQKLNWNFDAVEHIALAKEYGLDCNVGDSSKKDTSVQSSSNPEFSKQDFEALNITKRKQMQFALKKLGYYKSEVDGLWGRGTKSAINSYAVDRSISSGFPNSVFQSLNNEVNMQLFSETVVLQPKSYSATRKQKLCKLSGDNPFDTMKRRLAWELQTLQQFENMIQLILDGEVLYHGESQIRIREDGDWQWVFPLWCKKNDNHWRPCGSPSARIRLKRTAGGLKGRVHVPWEWSHGLLPTEPLVYICK